MSKEGNHKYDGLLQCLLFYLFRDDNNIHKKTTCTISIERASFRST